MNIEVDYTVDESQTPEQALEQLIMGFDGLVVSVIDPHGPSGWPVAKVTGSTEAVLAFADHYGYEV